MLNQVDQRAGNCRIIRGTSGIANLQACCLVISLTMKLRCAILDDYQNVASSMANWAAIGDKVEWNSRLRIRVLAAARARCARRAPCVIEPASTI
jgi:hypothetical protein